MEKSAAVELTSVGCEVSVEELDVVGRLEVTCVEREHSTFIPHSTPYIDMTAEVTNLVCWCLFSPLYPHPFACVT